MQRQPRSLLPDLAEWFTSLPSRAGPRPLFDTHLLRLEDEIQDGRCVVRAEIPGIDPARDVDITVRAGRLTIKAERSEKKEFDGRSEFSYGSFAVRSLCPPRPTRTASKPATTRASSPFRCGGGQDRGAGGEITKTHRPAAPAPTRGLWGCSSFSMFACAPPRNGVDAGARNALIAESTHHQHAGADQ